VRPAVKLAVLVFGLLALTLPASALAASTPHDQGKPFFDIRDTPARADQAAPAPDATLQAQAALRSDLGTQSVVQLDRITGTPRVVAKLDGFLTGPSAKAPAQVALDYVRSHADLFGLGDSGVAALELTDSFKDIDGITHLVWQQRIHGIPVFGNDLRASVSADGRLVNVLGSPLRSLAARAPAPGLKAEQALAAARRDAGAPAAALAVTHRSAGPTQETAFANGDRAELVYFALPGGPQLGWKIRAQSSSQEDYSYVIAAQGGDVLWRQNMVDFAAGGRVWQYYPSTIPACNGGCVQTAVNFPASWATDASGTKLQGNNVHAFKDLLDDNVPAAGGGDEIAASNPAGLRWDYPFTDFTASVGFFGNCDPQWQCSWDDLTANSWQTNLNQDATQVYYYVNKFHDHLLAAPIGFTEAAGNFQQTNSTGKGKPGDPVLANVDDGANIDFGFPDGNHINNANMSTPADGSSPRMQMYLFSDFVAFVDGNGGDDASVIYHEYTHGLSNRLIHFADGSSALNGAQGGAMGEAWSDWYAMDYLVNQGFDADTSAIGDLLVGFFISAGQASIRSEALDCPVGNTTGGCPNGGYTYADFGTIAGGPEVHADGEIWGQTIWQLRQQLGSAKTEALLTRAMMLGPASPSFLDQRNGIIQADTVLYGGANRSTIWTVFANRGMGFFASANDSNDVHPHADFTLPPTTTGTVVGNFKDVNTNAPIPEASAQFPGHNSGLSITNLVGTANWMGNYSIGKVPSGLYPVMLGLANGFDGVGTSNVQINAGATTTRNFSLRRDWAALKGGTVVTAFNGPDYSSFGCGPTRAIDQSLGSGWGSDTAGGPKFVTIKLPLAVNISTFGVDPGATCGDPDDASTAGYKIETSPDGTTFTQAAAGTFTAANNHILNTVTPTAAKTNVRYVRFTMNGPQVAASQFLDMSELEVFGAPTVTPALSGFTPASGITGSKVTINGAGFTGANAVWLNGLKAPTFTPSASSILVTVPNGASTGKFVVRTLGGAVVSTSAYTVTESVTGFTPAQGPVGTSVTINGAGFTSGSTVKFGGVAASGVTFVSSKQLKAVVPSGATASKIFVTTTGLGTVNSALNFKVT
jgi:extracellular elastinolytic metalloproteinase